MYSNSIVAPPFRSGIDSDILFSVQFEKTNALYRRTNNAYCERAALISHNGSSSPQRMMEAEELFLSFLGYAKILLQFCRHNKVRGIFCHNVLLHEGDTVFIQAGGQFTTTGSTERIASFEQQCVLSVHPMRETERPSRLRTWDGSSFGLVMGEIPAREGGYKTKGQKRSFRGWSTF